MVFVAKKCTIFILVVVGRCHVSRLERMMIGELLEASSVEKLDRCRWQLTSYFEVPSDQVCVLSFVAPWMVLYHVLAQTLRKNTFSDDVWTKMLAELGAFKNQRIFQSVSEHPQMVQMVRKSMVLSFSLREMFFLVLSVRYTTTAWIGSGSWSKLPTCRTCCWRLCKSFINMCDLVLESDNSRGWELPVEAPPGLAGRFHPNVTQAQPSQIFEHRQCKKRVACMFCEVKYELLLAHRLHQLSCIECSDWYRDLSVSAGVGGQVPWSIRGGGEPGCKTWDALPNHSRQEA